ncbi:DnaD domain protein [Scatolibacter rhodanostii]|uniref:DnaD domain protein n=1 Tax=Scatolibacter rhodanostii TaxID=2014781 RepID=UPI000C07A8DF|nr:DnaD domain protein [Scatolibacter rhodanostii]
MQYSLDMGLWRSVFAVPKDLVEKHIKLAGKEQLKTILWMLSHNGEPISAQEIALATGISLEGAEDSIQYWLNCGFIYPTDGTATQKAPNQKTVKPQVQSVPAQEATPAKEVSLPKRKQLIKPDGHYVATRINESPEIQYLIHESQTVLGKTISPALSSTLLAIHEDFGLPVEVIMMLIQYAKESGKTGTNYIEAVARDWYESNIFTLESAEQKLLELSQMRLAWKKFVSSIGIHDRPPSKKEEQLTYTWVYTWKMTPDLIAEAYDRCVNATGKLSLSYMNKIFEKWYGLGYKNISDVEKAENRRKEKAAATKSYDIDEIEKTGFFDPVEDF